MYCHTFIYIFFLQLFNNISNMADIEAEPPQSNGYANANDEDEDERGKMRPADIDAVSYQKILANMQHSNCY